MVRIDSNDFGGYYRHYIQKNKEKMIAKSGHLFLQIAFFAYASTGYPQGENA